MILGNPVQGRIIAIDEARKPTDAKLPNGSPLFRVTQSYGTPDAYWMKTHPGRPASEAPGHSGMDLGNFGCDAPVLAAEAGTAKTYIDNAHALAVILSHGGGWITRYWHLNRWTIPVGVAVPVRKGQQIGLVGMTGLGAICHLHFELNIAGRNTDPWPHLAQNQALPNTALQEDDVDPRRITPIAVCDVLSGGTGYPDPDRRGAPLLKNWRGGTNIGLYGVAANRTATPAPLEPIVVNMAGAGRPRDPRIVYMGADKIVNIRASGGGISLENKILRAREAADGAAQAVEVVRSSLK